MSFLVIAACVAVQWFLNFSATAYQYDWVTPYVLWMRKQFAKLTEGHGLFGLVILVLPILIVASILFTVVYHLLGHLGYSVLSLVLLWYCLDIAGIKTADAASELPVLFISAYQKIFALLFWYFIFGPVGLLLYVVIHDLRAYFEKEIADAPELQKYFVLTQSVLDWAPVRVLTLTFALGGDFAAVFKEWVSSLSRGVEPGYSLLTSCGVAAIRTKSSAEVVALLQRTLLIWLILIAITRIGVWIG